ncbi:hypothetical protein VP01_3477g1 [Puccinia sorghi]|uniref:Uncharacterized protein n=1 Tax=Puccinia sorghi TaxID=27349 RepID=A0A0L6UWT0_9BASI|nr:hypothetical protein VP01_3477g1 [Puccinia sorghi]
MVKHHYPLYVDHQKPIKTFILCPNQDSLGFLGETSHPSPEFLKEFYSKFSDAEHIQNVSENSSLHAMVPQPRLRHEKETFLQYSYSCLARVGLRIWCLNLEEPVNSLLNSACWIVALSNFPQVETSQRFETSGTYDDMRITKTYLREIDLFNQCFNHYGEFFLSCYKYNLPLVPENNLMLKTLPFCSDIANNLFCYPDKVMKDTIIAKGKRSNHCYQAPPTKPVMTLFPQAPKNLPLDFYNGEWFNDLQPTSKILPQETRNPDKKLSDKQFRKKYWSQNTTEYDLTHMIEDNQDNSDSGNEDSNDSIYCGEEVDLSDTLGKEDKDLKEPEDEISVIDDQNLDRC